MSTSDRTIRWIENLADQEVLVTTGEQSTVDISATKDDVLAGETAGFVRDLLYHVEYLVGLFNSRVGKQELQIRLLRKSDNPLEVALIRNSMKLTVLAPQPGAIRLQCCKVLAEENGYGPKTSMMFSGTIEGRFSTFHDVEWQFLANRVTAEQVARHYLTEFIQVSRFPSENN